LDPARMFDETGSQNFGGAVLGSVTDLVIDHNSLNEENIWIGIGDISLLPQASPLGGVWQSPNHGQTWNRRMGGQIQFVPNQTIPIGTGVRRVTLAIAEGRPSDEAVVYALINNPGAAINTPLSSGLYKTKSNGQGWTHVMLRQNSPTPSKIHNYV